MPKISLAIGTTVLYNNEPYEVLRHVDTKHLLARNLSTNTQELLLISDISPKDPLIGENVRTEPVHMRPSDVSDENWDIAKERLAIIAPLLHKERVAADVQNRAKEFNKHPSTLYRWINDYEISGLLTSLVPKHTNKGPKGQLRIREETELIVAKTIDDLYLSKQKLTPKKVYAEIVRKCSNARLEPPHENTVRNRIKQISDKKLIAGRESRMTAERRYRNTDGMFPEGLYPLDVLEIDHTPMDIIVVDEKHRQPIGRPYLTLAIDIYSRMVAGYFISFEEPSFFSVSQCLSQAILPKEKLLRSLDIGGDWNLWGIPRSIHMDNAQEFRGIELQRVCEQYGITIAWRPVARPQFGGHIERLIGTAMRELHTLPGTTFSSIKHRGEYDSNKEATMTLGELERFIVEFIVNVYHKSIHSGIGKSPEKRYEEGLFGSESTPGRGLPEKIVDEDTFRISLLPTIERTVQQFGVMVDKISYYADCLRRWIKAKENKKARQFIFKRDPRDISVIWFYDPDIKKYFPIPYRNVSYPPISVWELRSVQRYLEQKNLPAETEEQIFTAYSKMQGIVENATHKTKSLRRAVASKQTMSSQMKRDKPSPSSDMAKSLQSATDASLDDLFKDVKPFDEITLSQG